MYSYHLAQLNIAKMQYPIDSPEMQEFVDNLERINALADQAPGFVWRLQTEEGDATSIDYFGGETIVNMSVWSDLSSLHTYVYRTGHAKIMSQRKQWFDRLMEAYMVLWWIPAGHLPDLDEANERLVLLRRNGPSEAGFNFKHAFDPRGESVDIRKIVN
ncbi:MAG: DUF3291 domain-containing protein [bacterium]